MTAREYLRRLFRPGQSIVFADFTRRHTVQDVVDEARDGDLGNMVGVYRDGNPIAVLTPDEAERALFPPNLGKGSIPT